MSSCPIPPLILRCPRQRASKEAFRDRAADWENSFATAAVRPHLRMRSRRGRPDPTHYTTEISSSGSEPLTAYGTLARYVPLPSHPATPPGFALGSAVRNDMGGHPTPGGAGVPDWS